MRAFPTLALAVLAAALAGCTAGDDPNTPPNADPNPPQSLPPVSSTSASTGPPTTAPANTSSSTSSTTAPSPATEFEPHREEAAATDPDFPGLFVNGLLQGSGTHLRVEATANNAGERAYRIPDGSCAKPWRESLTDQDGDALAMRKTTAACPSLALREFAAHEFLSTALTWDGTLWSDEQGDFYPAPSGVYVWRVAFDVYAGGSGSSFDDNATLQLEFQVEVP